MFWLPIAKFAKKFKKTYLKKTVVQKLGILVPMQDRKM